MKETELKPCPFCGEKAHIYQDYTGYYVAQCDKCGIGTLLCGDEKTAKRRWDKRVKDKVQNVGQWIEENPRPKSTQFICSACNRVAYNRQNNSAKVKECEYKYCPNCGAKMKGGAE